MKHASRILALLLALLMIAPLALAEADRTAQVYDLSADAGALTVRFIDLGTPDDGSPGDCVFLTSPEGKIMMIDSGLAYSRPYLQKALDAMGITRIDYLVMSHPHGDHTQNMPYIMQHYEVGTVYSSIVDDPYANNYRNYMLTIAKKNLPHVRLAEGDVFYFGEQVKVEVFNPEKNLVYPENYEKENTAFVNNNSLVLKFTYGESTYLTAGDLYMAGESAVVKRHKEELDVDMIKINHHGYSTSSSGTWCNATNPEITVIPADSLYDFGILRRFGRKGEVHITGLEGTVCVRMYADDTKVILTERDYDYGTLNQFKVGK